MENNIFERACLIQLQTSCWLGTKRIESSVMEQIGNSDWLKGAKVLIDPESLCGIRSVITKGRSFLQKSALPFPINGLTLVPRDSISRIDEGLRELETEFHQEVQNFIRDYDQELLKARENLGELFDPTDYPLNVEDKFRFEWCFVMLSVPGKRDILTPEIYEREKAKFESLMEETRDLAVHALREEFAGIVRHMAERLNGDEEGKPKRFKASMIEKMREFLDGFEDRNLFEDEKLSGLVSQAREIISGVSVQKIKGNDHLRQYVAGEMEGLLKVVDSSLEDVPRRKIRMAA